MNVVDFLRHFDEDCWSETENLVVAFLEKLKKSFVCDDHSPYKVFHYMDGKWGMHFCDNIQDFLDSDDDNLAQDENVVALIHVRDVEEL
uniref:Uncharacterized protein n=1 Tax=Meloidogyne incognita TaxID=6306 RepID=A0A914MBU9_MELIC